MKYTDLQRIYGAAGRELRALMLTVDLATINGAKAEDIKRKARRIVTYLNAASGRWTRQITRTAYAKAETKAKAILMRLGKRRPRGPEPGRSGPDAVAEIAERALLKAVGSIMRTVEQFLAAALMASGAIRGIPATVQEFDYGDIEDFVGELVRDAVKNELARSTIKGRIMDKLRQLVADGKFITITTTAGERTYRLTKYAEMVARTALRNAQAAATIDSCRLYENDLVKITDHQTTCVDCKEFEGQTYSISGTDPEFPPLDSSGFLDAHPNCEHRALPTSREAIKAEEIFG